LRYTSWPIIAAMLALLGVGITAIHVAGGDALRQAVYAAVALGFFAAATIIPYQRVGGLAYPFLAATICLLVAVYFFPPVKNAHRWIDLGLFRIQPSEVAKLAYILMLARYLRYRDNYRNLRGLIAPFVLTFLPIALILPEPDLGTSLLFLPTLFVMLFVAGAKVRHLLGIIALGLLVLLLPIPLRSGGWRARLGSVVGSPSNGSALSYGQVRLGGASYALTPAPVALMASHPHQIRRVTVWADELRRLTGLGPAGEGEDPFAAGEGYQLRRSKMALGVGRWTGREDWNRAEEFFFLLPERHNDFIFAVIGGQWGFVGAVAVLFCYLVIFLFGLEIGTMTYDPFGRLLSVGVLALLLAQIWVNVGMTMGLVPITGMTLPLVSYGGSSLVVNGFALGLLVNVGQRRPILLYRRPFEHGQKKEKKLPVEGVEELRGKPAER